MSPRGARAKVAGGVLAVAGIALLMVFAFMQFAAPVASSDPHDTSPGLIADKRDALLEEQGEGGVAQPTYAPRAAATSSNGARYRPGEVLVEVGENADVSKLNDQIAGLDYLADQVLAPQDIALGWVCLALADGQDAEQAVVRLVEDGVATDAQLNYVYRLDAQDGTEHDGASRRESGAISEGAPQGGGGISPKAGLQALVGQSPSGKDAAGSAFRTGSSSGFVSEGVDDVPAPDDPDQPDEDELIQPDYASERYGAGFDPRVNSQWAIYATRADYGYKYLVDHLGEIGLESVDDASARPSVAIVDTGCYVQHEDLQANIVDYYDAVDGFSKATDDAARFRDVDGHGTNVSGVASAVTRNGIGIAGVGGNSGLVPIRVFQYDSDGELGAESADIVKAYQYVLEHAGEDRIKVVNLSLGADYEDESPDDADLALFKAIDKAAQRGILTVASAGNHGLLGAYCDFPTYLAESVVGSIAVRYTSDSADMGRAGFSNYNKEGFKVEQLSGPGSRVLTTASWVWNGTRWLTRQNAYEEVSGTSFAAPCIAGAAAVVWSVNPGLSVDEMKSVLFSSAHDIVSKGADDLEGNSYGEGFDLMTGFGEVDVCAAAESSSSYLSGVTSIAPGISTALVPHVPRVAGTPSMEEGEGEWVWTSSDPQSADVSDGVVTGRSAGAAVITASNDSLGLVVRQVVTVHGASIEGAGVLRLGGRDALSIVEPLANNGAWKWSSSNAAVVSVGEDTGSVYGAGLGDAVITAQLESNPEVRVSHQVQVVDAPAPAPASPAAVTQAMHRLYNPHSGEHFYTANAAERNNLVRLGWRYEGEGWKAPAEGMDVYRLYNPNAGDHHYTMSALERDALRRAGWRYEGVGWKSAGAGGVPLYRQYNPNARAGSHNYTTSKAENDMLVRVGWRSEDIGWYGA